MRNSSPTAAESELSGHLSGSDLAKACVYTGGAPSIFEQSNGDKEKGMAFSFCISCKPVLGSVLQLYYNGSPSLVQCEVSSIAGGWTAPCSGTLYLSYYCGLPTHAFGEFRYVDYYDRTHIYYPDYYIRMPHYAYKNGVSQGSLTLAGQFDNNHFLTISVSGGDEITFGSICPDGGGLYTILNVGGYYTVFLYSSYLTVFP